MLFTKAYAMHDGGEVKYFAVNFYTTMTGKNIAKKVYFVDRCDVFTTFIRKTKSPIIAVVRVISSSDQ
jgi:hypothetical protein